MADPLSIAASIAGVISLADIVFIRTRKYLSSAKNADKEVKELSQEVLLLSGALHSLSKLAQALDAEGLKDQHIDSLRMHHIAACHATLDEVSKKLKKVEDNAAKRKLVWPFVSDRTKELLAEISRHKQNIDLALTADSLGTLLQVLSKTEEVQANTEKILEEAKKTREIITRINQDSGRKAVINYFLPYNPQQHYEMSLSLRHPRTGLWLTRKPEFQTWLEHPDSALWLSGIPGAGKTVLAGTIIEEALKRSSEDIAITFFFCDYKRTNTQTPVNVLSALASQLAIQKEEAYGYLERYYQELHPERALERRSGVSDLQRILKDMVKSFDHVYLVVDGLDECGNNTDDVIDGILDVIECSDNISTALLSRDEYNIRDRLEDDFTGVEITAHTEDITEYVTSEIEKRISNKSLRIDDLSLKGEILERLIDGAKGMFRWVACQLDFLGDCLSDKECREALRQLPPGLNESYMRILQRVPTGKERTVQMILNFVAYANPKLDLPILREALSVPEKVGKDDSSDPHSTIHEGSITRLCRSLIRKSNDGCHYEFAHFSVKEFLEGEMMCMPEFEAFQVSKSICHLLLAKQCLKYLLLRNFSSLPSEDPRFKERLEMRIKQHPFYSYAAVCWPVFARSHWLDESLVKLAERLFQPKKTANFITWALELASFATFQYHCCENPCIVIDCLNDSRRSVLDLGYYADYTLSLLPQLVDKNFTTLHMAAALSLPVICSILIKQGGNIDQRSGFGCPLQCAVQGLYLAGVHEDDSSSFIDPYFIAKYWQERTDSSRFGRGDTTRLLLSSGATHISACSSPFAGHTLITAAMQLAYRMEDISVISILLEAGYELEEDNLSQFAGFGKDCLRSAAGRNDHDDEYGLRSLVVCLSPMMDKSAARFRLCKAAWSLAIEMGCGFAQDPSIVDTRISLSRDALVTTILTSVQDGDIETLNEALTDPRADLASLIGDDEGLLEHLRLYMFRSSHGLTMLNLLLSAGMEVNRLNDDGLLPVHMLVKSVCHKPEAYGDDYYDVLHDTINEFIRKGTGCNARSRADQNVFHLGLGSIRLIKAIFAAETDENILTALRIRDENGHTPITLAVQDGQDEVALLLLEMSNCDPEALKGPASVHALCVTGGTHRAFNALLDAAVELDLTGCIKTTLLHHVGPKTSKEFVLQLIQMYPKELLFRADGKLPIDAYFESCINCKSPTLDPDVLQLLAVPKSEGFDQQDKKLVWENLTLSVQGVRPLKENYDWTRRKDIPEIITKMITSLLQLGFVQSYEAVTHVSGVLPLLEPLRSDLDDLWPLSTEAISGLLQETVFRETLCESDPTVRLLKAAVKRCDVALVELLLKNGISVHQRIDKMSALEAACLAPTKNSGAKQIFTVLLDNSDTSRLDEINPHHDQRRGLVHYLAGPGKRWQLEELLKRGADVNLRTNVHMEAQPAILQHLWEGSLESAMTLLDMGANPAMADIHGMDTALTAAAMCNMDLLLHLYTTESQDWQLNWKQTCNALFRGTGGLELVLFGANALHWAAERGNCDFLRFYLDKGLITDVNAVSVELWTPMHIAALAGQIDAVKFLYSRGASLNLKSADGSLPLHLAVRNQRTGVVKFLVENESAMDADIRGLSPVGYAIQLQNQSIIDCLRTSKQYFDSQSKPGGRDKDLVYAYEQALKRGDVDDCELLRGQGCPVNADLPGQNGRSALVLAIESSNEKLIKWLLAHDAKANEQTRNADRIVLSPLQAMMMRPQLNDVLPLLLQKHRNEGGSAAAERPSLICIAIQHDNTQGLGLLLEHMATYETENLGVQVSEHTNHSVLPVNQHRLGSGTPLHWAAGRGNCEAIKMLLDDGADVNVFDVGGMTPLQRAIELALSKKSPAAKLLLSRGAALEPRDQRGSTAVMLASKQGNTELVRLLAEAGADLKAADFSSWTCLHLAADYGHLETFAWLVNRGLQLHAKNSNGWSAVHYALFNSAFSSFFLNFGCAFEDIDAITYATPECVMGFGPAWLKEHFNMYLRRLGLDRLRALANLEPTDSWSPLCILASIGQTLAVTNILRLGPNVDFEGSPSGSALMAACSSGRLESVKILVRHGAAISYLGKDANRSAVDAARNHRVILAWLLVDRFTEQRKLSDPPEAADSAALSAQDAKPWSGISKKELIITGTAERQVHESARSYWFRLMVVKEDWRGKVVVQNQLAQTHRPSRLIPDESVRICPGDYGTPKEQRGITGANID